MPPQMAMGELPPPCSTLKTALTQMEGGEVSLEGLRSCPDAMAQWRNPHFKHTNQAYHRRTCKLTTKEFK